MEPRRHIALEGASNVRDLGGYPTRSGQTTRWGLVFRADSLDELTEADHAILGAYGIRMVCDLRRPGEGSEVPPQFLGEGTYRRFGMSGEASQGYWMLERVMSGEVSRLDVSWMSDIYLELARDYGPRYGDILRLLADRTTPLLVHCAAGKDRTGLAAALLLSALGVDEDAVLDDYVATDVHRAVWHQGVRERLARVGVDYDDVRAFFGAEPAVMATTLAALRERHGSIEGYLEEVAGVDAGVVAALRGHLLEP